MVSNCIAHARAAPPHTRELVRLVNEAAKLVHARGEAAFADLRVPGHVEWRDERGVVLRAGNVREISVKTLHWQSRRDCTREALPIVAPLLLASSNDEQIGRSRKQDGLGSGLYAG